MPIREPSQSPEPKSAWTGESSPIERIIVAESGATGSRSTRWFQTLEAGKTWQPPIVGAVPVAAAATAAAKSAAMIASVLTRTIIGAVCARPYPSRGRLFR